MRKLIAVSALALLAGCTYVPLNPPLSHPPDLSKGYRWATTTIPKRESRTLVILTFSGGGTRAAGLSYGILKQLEATPVPGPGNKTLLDTIDVISSVSGGSFTSMDFGMRGRAMLSDFETKFLQQPVTKMLFNAAYLNPKNLLKLMFNPNFHRIDVATEVYQKVLFGNATFTDLLAKQRTGNLPLIVANSSELEMGARFEWTQDHFDPICSDLSTIPVARAVAASSDFPVLLPPTILQKYDASVCQYKTPTWVPNAFKNDAYLNPARTRYASELEAYLNPDRKFLHLLDGGIADNIGLRGPLQGLMFVETFVQAQGTLTGMTFVPLLNQAPGARPIDHVLVIVVNAGAQGKVTIDTTSREPKLPAVIGGIVGAPMDNYSFDTIQLLINTVANLDDDGVRYYPVQIAIPLLRGDPGDKIRDTINNIGTSFNALTDDQLNALKQAADILIHQDPCFQQFVRDLNGQPMPPGAAPCPSAMKN
jgi:NTE family protein